LNRTLPLPSPDDPEAASIQDVSLRALHAQPPGAVTLTDIWPPPASASPLDGDTVNRHGAASCVTATRCSPTTTAL
jgi:hypothetical protein